MKAVFIDFGTVHVSLLEGETLARLEGPLELDINPQPGLIVWDALVAAELAPEIPNAPNAPLEVTLQEWRSGLDLWMIDDPANPGQKIARLSQVYAAVKPIVDAGNAIGKVAMQQLEYANMVQILQLMKIKDAFGFTQADCEESMWRAMAVRAGDYSGNTPAAMQQAAP